MFMLATLTDKKKSRWKVMEWMEVEEGKNEDRRWKNLGTPKWGSFEKWDRWLAGRITVTYECDLHCMDIMWFVQTWNAYRILVCKFEGKRQYGRHRCKGMSSTTGTIIIKDSSWMNKHETIRCMVVLSMVYVPTF
jgi:hypothetical protein